MARPARSFSGAGLRRAVPGVWLMAAATVAVAVAAARASAAPAPDADDVCPTPAAATQVQGVVRSLQAVQLPAVRLRQHNGQLVGLEQAMDDGKPVLLNFVFTSCTTICPPMSMIFAALQDKLGARRSEVQMLSISIDPGYDTPARLKTYAERFDAGPQWRFHTGSQEAVDSVQRAFSVYRPDKMGHTAVTFVRPRGARQWVRLDGFAAPEQLMREAFASAP
jgi:protein SCO1/2